MYMVLKRLVPRIRRGLRQSTSQVESPTIQDEVNISDAARLVEQAKQAPDIRQDRVQAIRARLPPALTRRPASSTRPSTGCWTRSGKQQASNPAKANMGVWPRMIDYEFGKSDEATPGACRA